MIMLVVQVTILTVQMVTLQLCLLRQELKFRFLVIEIWKVVVTIYIYTMVHWLQELLYGQVIQMELFLQLLPLIRQEP